MKKQKFDEERLENEARAQRPSSRGYRAENSPRGGQQSNATDGDPFEFSDESSASNLFKSHSYRREENGIAETDENCYTPMSPSTAGAGGATGTGAGFKLGLSELELRPTMDDLNNIFDSSDSESNGPGGLPGAGGSDTECRGDQVSAWHATLSFIKSHNFKSAMFSPTTLPTQTQGL